MILPQKNKKRLHPAFRTADRSGSLGPLAVLAGLAAAGFLIYSNSLGAGFYSDAESIPRLIPLIGNFRQMIASCEAFGFSRCIPWLTFVLNYRLGGLDPFGYHLVNILVHIGASFFVYALVSLTLKTPKMEESRPFSDARILPVLAAAIFLTHPVQTQAVTYIWQRQASLASFFYLAAITFYARARLRGGRWSGPACFAAMLLSFFSKEISVTLPVMILLYEGLFFGWRKKLTRGQALLLAGVAAGFAAGLLATMYRVFLIPDWFFKYYMSPHAYNGRMTLIGWDYLITQINVVRTYIRLAFFPVRQNFAYFYPYSSGFFEPATLASFGLLTGVLASACLLCKKYRLLSFGIFWFFIALSAESTFLPLRDVIFEHRMYLPLAGFSVFLSALFCLCLKNRAILIAAGTGLVIAFSAAAYSRNFVWASEITLWQDAVKKEPGSPQARHNLGIAYAKAGRRDEAQKELNECLAILGRIWKYPKKDNLYVQAHHNIGMLLFHAGRFDEAAAHFREALNQGDPNFYLSVLGLGIAEMRLGHLDEAVKQMQEGLGMHSLRPQLYLNLGLALDAKGDVQAAIPHYRKALELDPELIEARNRLGLIFARLGWYDQAAAEYRKALGVKPHPVIHHHLAAVFKEQGKWEEAMEEERKALRLDPGFVAAVKSLADLQARRRAEAAGSGPPADPAEKTS